MNQPLVKPKTGEEDPELEKLIEFYNETLGFCPNSVRTMHIRPRIAYAFIEMNQAVMENNGQLTSSLKRLIGYVSSHVAGCRYCQAHTILAAERYGAPQQQLDDIWTYQTSDAFSPAEKAALDFAIASSTVPNVVTDSIAENLRSYWTEGDIVEILGVVSLFGFLNRWNDSMGTELEGPAKESAQKILSSEKWEVGKHSYPFAIK
tara:strand:- start:76 stop:690 length:615 start_codon:yes stop_codon:yes gene_type:complete